MSQDSKLRSNQIVRALDLGSGFAKLNRLENGALTYLSIPSLAPRHSGTDLSMSMLGKRDTVVVTVDGTSYEVGPDSADLDSNDSTRNLNDQYIYTDQYRAVFYGALHYINEEVIDLLVVGLPLTTLHRAADLKKMMIGEHQINATTKVTVKDALVLPQPMGAMHYCLSKANKIQEFEFLDEETNLFIDPGYLTFDFLLTNGRKINDARSNARAGGVSQVLRAISESLSHKFGIKYDNLTAIDRALERRKIKINGQVEPMLEHIKNARPAIEGSVNFLRNIAGDGSDIDNIILVGGGQSIFAKTILNYYKSHKVYVLPDAQFANVKGFQAAGEGHLGLPIFSDDEFTKLDVIRYAPPEAPAASPAKAPEAAPADI